MKSIAIFIITLVIIAPISVQGDIFGRDYLKEANSYSANTDYQRVVIILEEGFNKNKIAVSSQADAYKLLGYAYYNLGDKKNSQNNFRKAVANNIAKGKTSQLIFSLGKEQLKKLEPLILSATKKNNALKRKIAHQILKFSISRIEHHDFFKASLFSDFAIKIDSKLKTPLFEKFFESSKNSQNVYCLSIAAKLASGNPKNQKMILGFALKKAVDYWPNTKYLAYKNIANQISSRETKDIFPGGTENKPIFSWSITLKDQGSDEYIKVFDWGEVFPKIIEGDRLQILCTTIDKKKYNGVEVEWWKGKWYRKGERWGKTKKGQASWLLKRSLKKGGFYMRIPTNGKNIVTTIQITRKVKRGPQKKFLANL